MQRVLALGKHPLAFPIEPLPGVAAGLAELQRRGHPLMVLTKGDLFDQESKLARSRLGDYLAHVELVSEKDAATYRRLLARHGVPPAAFVLVGNSLKLDVLPVAQLGGWAIHVPYPPPAGYTRKCPPRRWSASRLSTPARWPRCWRCYPEFGFTKTAYGSFQVGVP